jgi:hypothetical protein
MFEYLNSLYYIMKKLFILLAIFTTVAGMSQSVGINDDGSAANASAMLDVSSTTKGFLLPRMTNSQMTSIGSPGTPPAGMQVWCTDCGPSGELRLYNGTSWTTFLPAPNPVTIGLHPELGGYVFYVSTDGLHGLVSETQDQGNTNWYNAQNLISNVANHSTDGKKFTDWRLPTINELIQMYNSRSSIGGFGIGGLGFSTVYWSSTEGDSTFAYYFNFDGGDGNDTTNKYSGSAVRGVRAF